MNLEFCGVTFLIWGSKKSSALLSIILCDGFSWISTQKHISNSNHRYIKCGLLFLFHIIKCLWRTRTECQGGTFPSRDCVLPLKNKAPLQRDERASAATSMAPGWTGPQLHMQDKRVPAFRRESEAAEIKNIKKQTTLYWKQFCHVTSKCQRC